MKSLVEMIHEGKESNVVWRKRGYIGWFYYPDRQRRRIFGRFSVIFSVISSMTQFCINIVAVVTVKNFVKFNTLLLLLSSSYLVALLVDHGVKDMFKSEVHGRCLAECSRHEGDTSVRTKRALLGKNLPKSIPCLPG